MSKIGAVASRCLSFITEFIYPPTCPVCGVRVATHGELCGECWTQFDWIDDPKCHICGYPFGDATELPKTVMCPVCAAGDAPVDWMRSACVYDDMSRSVMLPFKHGGRIKHATFMSRAMIWAMRDMVDTDINIDVVMPVPLATKRLRHRTYNQAMLLARPIAHAFNRPIDVDSVRRAHRPDMGHKTAAQRTENIRGVFNVVRPEMVRGKNILLVDDVFTTGATFRELRRVLMRAGAAGVYGVTFCRVVRVVK
ncbi:ComF family protein [bacterium]|nr:ComF family protein [bacterium]